MHKLLTDDGAKAAVIKAVLDGDTDGVTSYVSYEGSFYREVRLLDDDGDAFRAVVLPNYRGGTVLIVGNDEKRYEVALKEDWTA